MNPSLPIPGPDWLYWLTSVVLLLAAVPTLYWALWHDRAHGRRRCPRCFYDLAGATAADATTDGEPPRCSECGHRAPTAAALFTTRRRWCWATVAVSGLVLSAISMGVPIARAGDPFGRLPTNLLIGLDAFATESLRAQARSELERRLWSAPGALSEWQSVWAVRRLHLEPNLRRVWPAGVTPRFPDRFLASTPIGSTGFRVDLEGTTPGPDRSSPGDAPDFSESYDRVAADTWVEAAAGTRRIRLVFRLNEAQNRAEGAVDPTTGEPWSLPAFASRGRAIELPMTVAGTLDQVLKPRSGPEIDALTQEMLGVRVSTSLTDDSRWLVTTNRVDPGRVGLPPLGVRVEVRRSGVVMATARLWTTHGQMPGYPTLLRPTADEPTGLVALRDADPRDAAWDVRVTGDAELTLLDPSATERWVGSFTLPLWRALGLSGTREAAEDK